MFTLISRITVIPKEEPRHPCNPSPCGSNAVCKELNGAGSCTCLPDYFGDPYSGCRPECVMNSDCPRNRACVNNKCTDPCPGTCGINADCRVNNHVPTCICLPGFTGNPLQSCRPIPSKNLLFHTSLFSVITFYYLLLKLFLAVVEEPKNPCQPSPCGPFSQCRVVNGHAVCSCQTNYIGAPPTCRPECTVSTDCAQDKACINQKCRDPCPGTCGLNARCNVINHNPICSCPPGQVGDPFVRCIQEESKIPSNFKVPAIHDLLLERPVVKPSGNPCIPTPCGPNSVCRVVGDQAACSCLPNFIGRAPNCRPECTINAECPGNLACIRERCQDPCPGSCGVQTTCTVIKHSPNCQCIPGYTGDPFAGCSPVPVVEPVEDVRTPCNPSPCGANAVCREQNGAGSCTCIQDYFGDPYTGCRPECVTNTDCPRDKACLNNKCKNPCLGTCGINAECIVSNHFPSCFCLQGYTGNPSTACHLPPPSTYSYAFFFFQKHFYFPHFF